MERAGVLTDLFPSLLHMLPVFLYAETHYRFRYFFSFLRKHEPEIIADAPHRIEPNQPLPILVLVKDAHQFPVKMNEVHVSIRTKGKTLLEKKLLHTPLELTEKLWWRVFEVPLDGISGNIECDVVFEIDDGKRQLFYHNDNYRTSSHQPLKIFVAPSPLPRFEHLHFGECHSHSSYTEDQVEFGAPLEASTQLSLALGLSFFCVTDHSYDLDDSVDNYLMNDSNLPKWSLLQQEVDDQNSKHQDFVIVRGEEVTCRNSKDQNIHLLLLGNRKFFHGSGDGAEHWLKTRSENSIHEILNSIEPSVLSFAAHPKERVSFLQRLLLRRGKWLQQDFIYPQLTGIQFVNGDVSEGFWQGYHQWIEALSEGKRIFVLAGDDAHGNFNRFRQIGIPFLKIRETGHQLFGKMRTGVYLESLSEENILRAIHSGKTIVTDGPVVNLLIDSPTHGISSIGETVIGNKHSVSLEVRSSSEYGSIDSVKVFMGSTGVKEIVFISERLSQKYTTNRNFSLEIRRMSYIRAEVWTSSFDSNDAQPHFCLTNPIWLVPAFHV
ncbi:MAG: CehA/McbA family metallohydrolase [Bacteroidota bacterium]